MGDCDEKSSFDFEGKENHFPLFHFIKRVEWNILPDIDVDSWLRPPLQEVVFIHTGWPTDYCTELEDFKEHVRDVQNQHIHEVTRKWRDLAYNFLIASDGTVYEGRGWDVQGAVCYGHNSVSYGIAFMGRFPEKTKSEPTPAALLSAVRLVNFAIATGRLVDQGLRVLGFVLGSTAIHSFRNHLEAPANVSFYGMITNKVKYADRQVHSLDDFMQQNEATLRAIDPNYALDETAFSRRVVQFENICTATREAVVCEMYQKIGSGTFGDVYAAHYRKDNQDTPQSPTVSQIHAAYALKIVKKSGACSAIKVAFLAKLSHPHLVAYLACGMSQSGSQTDKGPFYILMDRYEGGTLNCLAKQRNLMENEIIAYLLQLVEAVSYLHGLSPQLIVHCDIKGSNIFLELGGNSLRLGDLDSCGTQHSNKSLSLTETILTAPATLTHKAPELIAADPKHRAGPPCDIYSTGCVGLEMLNGGEVYHIDRDPQSPEYGQRITRNLDTREFHMKMTNGTIELDFSAADAKKISSEFRMILKHCVQPAKLRPSATELLKILTELKADVVAPTSV